MKKRIGREIVRRIMACAAAAVLAACMVTGCGKKPAETTAAPTQAEATTAAPATAAPETTKAETTAAETTQEETTAPETTAAPVEKAEPGTPEAAKELAKDVWYAVFGGANIPDKGSVYESKELNAASRQIFLGLAVSESGAYTGSEKKDSDSHTIGAKDAEKLLTSVIGVSEEAAKALVSAQEAEGENIVLYNGDWGGVSPFIEADSVENGIVKGTLGFDNHPGRTAYEFSMQLAESADSPFGYAFERLSIESAEVEDGVTVGENAPEFLYGGSDPIVGAACQEILADAEENYGPGQIEIPSPRVLYVDDADPEDVKVFGYFNIDGYTVEGKRLMSQSGGRVPGVMHMKEAYGRYVVTSFEKATDGAGHDESIREFCKDYDGLADRFFAEADDEDKTRTAFARMYVLENSLDIESYQDYGWNPVELF